MRKHITVVKWKFPYPNGQYDRSYVGDCLEIISKDNNLLLVRNIIYDHFTPFILDTNEVEFRPVKDYFVKEIIELSNKKTQVTHSSDLDK